MYGFGCVLFELKKKFKNFGQKKIVLVVDCSGVTDYTDYTATLHTYYTTKSPLHNYNTQLNFFFVDQKF